MNDTANLEKVSGLMLVSQTVERLADILGQKEQQCGEVSAGILDVLAKSNIEELPHEQLQNLDQVQQCLLDISNFLRGLGTYAITAELTKDDLELVISNLMLHDLKTMLRGEHWGLEDLVLHDRDENGEILLF